MIKTISSKLKIFLLNVLFFCFYLLSVFIAYLLISNIFVPLIINIVFYITDIILFAWLPTTYQSFLLYEGYVPIIKAIEIQAIVLYTFILSLTLFHIFIKLRVKFLGGR